MKRLNYDYCKAAPVLEWMSRKWALVVLLRMEVLCNSPMKQSAQSPAGVRFGDLFREIPGISEKMLASTLDYLESEGLAVRNVRNTFPPSVEYSITPLGASFLKEIGYVIEWGHLHFEEIQEARGQAKSWNNAKSTEKW